VNRFIKRTLPILIALAGTGIIAALAAGMGAYYYLAPGLPDADEIRDVPLQSPLKVYTRDGKLIAQVGEKWRTPVAFEEIPPVVANAFLAAEDDRFYEHPGFDYQGIARAGFKYLTTGSRAQGGSTITQQLARDYFLTRDRTFIRKGKELILALRIENEFSKDEILALYLNKIFLGQRAYGIAAAAEIYFGKALEDVTVAEAAVLAGLPKAPSSLNPVTNPTRALERRSYVLRRMKEAGYIDEVTFEEAMNTPLESKRYSALIDMPAPYVAAEAQRYMVKNYGQDKAYSGGYSVVTTVDSQLQNAARAALRKGLLDYDYRHGYRGTLGTLNLAEDVPSLGADPVLTRAELDRALKNYRTYGNLELGVILQLNDDNSAEVYVRGKGVTAMPWERLKRSPYITETQVGPEPQSASEYLEAGSVVELLSVDNSWQLAQTPQAQGAIISMDPFDGALTAMTGGFDFSLSKFNRAMKSLRQPGSSIKPFVYSAALDNGFTAASIVNDAPLVIPSSELEGEWRPRNFGNKFKGPTRLREGLVNSTNLVAVRTLLDVGYGAAIDHIKPFGLPSSALPRNASMALGSGGATPMDMVGAYAALASSGHYRRPYIIERVIDARGETVYNAETDNQNITYICERCRTEWYDDRKVEEEEEPLTFLLNDETEEAATEEEPADLADDLADDWTGDEPADRIDTEVPVYADFDTMVAEASTWRPDEGETPLFFAATRNAKRIISAENAYIVYDMMRDVIRRGSGRRALELNRKDLGGKTGTTNDGVDVWFSGINSQIAATAWIGFDDNRSLGRNEQGGRTALPMWNDFMRVALQGQPEAPLERPEGIVTVRISRETGELAGLYDRETMFEIFIAGTEPQANPEGRPTLPPDDEVDEVFGDSDIF